MMDRPAYEAATPKTVLIGATYLKAHRRVTSLWSKKAGLSDQRGRLFGCTRGGMNTKVHAVTDAEARAVRFFTTAGQVNDYTGAAALLGSLPPADWLSANWGYDADWFRDALKDKGIKPCIPSRKSRGKRIKHDKRCNRIEVMFGRLKDWRRVATR
jgi:transposase